MNKKEKINVRIIDIKLTNNMDVYCHILYKSKWIKDYSIAFISCEVIDVTSFWSLYQ